jgi:hypothetical protein
MTHRWLTILVLSIVLLVRSSAFSSRLLMELNRNVVNSDAALRRLTAWKGCARLAASTQEGAIAEGDSDSEVEGDVDSEVGNEKKFSKVKWKRKRFLMMQDVQKRIQKGDPHAPRKAQEMVRRMWNLYEKSGDDLDYKPTLQAYNLWIHALARSGLDQAGHLAEEVLEEMKSTGIQPNVITYTSVMDAHAKSQSSQRAEKVLFDLLEETAKSSDLALTTITCDTFLNAMAQIGTREAAERAQDILLRLEHFQNEAIRPTKVSYSTGRTSGKRCPCTLHDVVVYHTMFGLVSVGCSNSRFLVYSVLCTLFFC